mmetsp:Transcript_19243/g.32204  ORF Transcript_19243/g.32204 Transcript_19243/m.32204 type:complete len:80 (+) Transcript_19243:435-674(+)
MQVQRVTIMKSVTIAFRFRASGRGVQIVGMNADDIWSNAKSKEYIPTTEGFSISGALGQDVGSLPKIEVISVLRPFGKD